MFRIIGGDGNEYGPVSADVLRQWLAQGRVNGATRVRREGADWTTLGRLSEFSDLTPAGQSANSGISLKLVSAPEPEPEQPVRRRSDRDDYHLDYRSCFARGWQAVRGNLGLVLVGMVLYLAVNITLNGLGKLPFDRAVFGLISSAVGALQFGGLMYLLLRAVRGENASFGNLFAAFRNLVQILIAFVVQWLVGLLCFVPALIFAAIAILPAMQQQQPPPPAALKILIGLIVLGVIPCVHLTVSWVFALPLMVDRRLGWSAALKFSWQRTHVHWWRVFGLCWLCFLVTLLGALACGVGVLISLPLAFGALMAAYDDIFPPIRA